MVRLLIAILLAACLAMGLAACGDEEAAPTATTAPAPTAVPAATAAPTAAPVSPTATTAPAATPAAGPTPVPATAAPVPTPAATTVAPAAQPTAPAAATAASATTAPSDEAMLAEYAVSVANGLGAIYAGDFRQLIGPPPHEGLMFVPEDSYTQAFMTALFGVEAMGIPGHQYIFTSDYYQELLQKANLLNPTELTSSGESIEIQHTCIDRNLPTCVLVQAFWAPNLAARTNGQVKLSVTSFTELGISGADTLSLAACLRIA